MRRLFHAIKSANPSTTDLVQLWPKLHHSLLAVHHVATALCTDLVVPKRGAPPLACSADPALAARASLARDTAVAPIKIAAHVYVTFRLNFHRCDHFSWICAGMYMCGALPPPVCA